MPDLGVRPRPVTPIPPAGDQPPTAFWVMLGAVTALFVGAVVAVITVVVAGPGGVSTETAVTTATSSPSATESPSTLAPPVESTDTTAAPSESTEPSVASPPTTSAAATGPSTTVLTGPATDPCSAADLAPVPAQPGLPEAVAEKRAAIVAAATSCRIDELVALTGPDFTASFGGGDPATVWADLERSGEEPLRFLAELMALPYSTITSDDVTIYVWPSASSYESWAAVPAGDRDVLADLYDANDFASFEEFDGYTGHRVGIDETGRWLYFVAGD